MAQRLDDGTQPTAHSAVQAMIIRAQHVADQTGKRVGLTYDLVTDQIALVELRGAAPKEIVFFRIVAPTTSVSEPVTSQSGDSVELDDALDPTAECSRVE